MQTLSRKSETRTQTRRCHIVPQVLSAKPRSPPTWPCVCGPCAPSRPPRSSTRCGSCPSCVQRLLSWLWTGRWSCWPGFLQSKLSGGVQMSSFQAVIRLWPLRIREGEGGRDVSLCQTKPGLTSADGWLAIEKTLWISKRGKKTGHIYHPVSKPWSPSSSWTGWTWAGCAEPGCRQGSRCNNGPTARPLPAGCWNGHQQHGYRMTTAMRKIIICAKSKLGLLWSLDAVLDDLMSQ